MKYLFTLCLLVFTLSASAQWQQTGSKVRYVNGLGIPTRDTAAGVAADSSQILIRPADSSLYVKYKRTWLRVGGGGGSIAGSGTTNYITKFTSSTAIGNSQIFDNGTNVGLGTITPTAKFDVNGVIKNNDRILANTNNANGTAAINTFFNNSTIAQFCNFTNVASTTQYGFMQGSDGTNYIGGSKNVFEYGNVGIGTTSPNFKLDVNHNGVFAGSFVSSAQETVLRLRNTATNGRNWYLIAGGNGGSFNSGQFGIYDETASAARLAIDASGNVGINQVSPAGRFVVADGQTLLGTNTNNGVDRLQVSGSASVTSLFGVGTSPSAGTVHIKTTSPSIAIDDNDNAGTAAIRFRPQSASFATRGSIELVSTGSAAPTRFVIASTDTMTFRTNNVERMRVTSAGGNVLISKTTDNGIDKLQVNGSIDAKGFAQAYTARGSTYTATTSDYLIDCTTGTFTVNLPDALLNVGRILIIKNSGTGTITVDGSGTQTIDGAATYSLSAQWATVQIMCDGNNWKILAKF